MLKEERQELILLKLNAMGKVVASQLAIDLSVSEDTIRRDLFDMDKNHLLRRVYGGALSLNRPAVNYIERENYEPELKHKLASKGISLLEDHQLIVIDGGTSNLQFARIFPHDLELTVLTNSVSIANELYNHKNIKIIMIGGNLFTKSMTNVGDVAVQQVKCYHPDLCFLGVYAIHPTLGISIPHEEEVSVKREIVKASNKVISLITPNKFNVISNYKVCDIEEITTIITDNTVNEDILREYREKGIECL